MLWIIFLPQSISWFKNGLPFTQKSEIFHINTIRLFAAMKLQEMDLKINLRIISFCKNVEKGISRIQSHTRDDLPAEISRISLDFMTNWFLCGRMNIDVSKCKAPQRNCIRAAAIISQYPWERGLSEGFASGRPMQFKWDEKAWNSSITMKIHSNGVQEKADTYIINPWQERKKLIGPYLLKFKLRIICGEVSSKP